MGLLSNFWGLWERFWREFSVISLVVLVGQARENLSVLQREQNVISFLIWFSAKSPFFGLDLIIFVKWQYIVVTISLISTLICSFLKLYAWFQLIIYLRSFFILILSPDHLLMDRFPNIGPLISRWDLTNSKIAETKALEPLKSWHLCISNFRTC